MNVPELMNSIQESHGCILDVPSGIPQVRPGEVLPEDLLMFYQLCGGAVLFEDSHYPIWIVKPEEFLPADPVLSSTPQEDFVKDLSDTWYILGKTEIGDYITIDLAPARLGRCYSVTEDRYAMSGFASIIALSFTDFLTRAVANRGHGPYWEDFDFNSLGDAYDD